MPAELRKRPAPAADALPAKKKAPSKAAATPKTKAAPKGKKAAAEEAEAAPESIADEPMGDAPPAAEETATESVAPSSAKVAMGTVAKTGETIDLEGFGGEVETTDGNKVTLAKLVEDSKAGVVVFTYSKASTPGCTKQACLFRDSYEPLTATGLSIYGLSTDSPKANTTFKTKQNLPFTLLCDPQQTLIGAIGFKKAAKSTQRGVFVVDKSGKVLATEEGGPAPTVEAVKKVVAEMGGSASGEGSGKAEESAKVDDKRAADTAGEVADTAEKIDEQL